MTMLFSQMGHKGRTDEPFLPNMCRLGDADWGMLLQVVNSSFCTQNVGTYVDSKLQYSCHLFSRKFGPQTVDKILDIVSKSASCYELGILAPKMCRP